MSLRQWASAAAMAALFCAVTPAAARADDTIGGYTLTARANPLQITYDSPGLLPVSPIVQVSVPESYATLNTGPTGYSLASLTFPGPLIADLATALKQQGPACQPPFDLPTYPLRAEAFSPQGPTETDASPVPGSRMRAAANGALSTAFSAWNDVALPSIFAVGGATGTSSSSGAGAAAVTKARSVVSGFSMLGGAIQIDSVVTDLSATSDGDKGSTKGTTRVSGATVGGQAVTIDENGVTLAGNGVAGVADLLGQVSSGLNDALMQGGISIKLVDHRETNEGGLAERIADGVVIEINYNGRTAPLVSMLLAAIPTSQLPADNATECAPSSPQGLVNLFKKTHIESFALGGATVSSNASAAFEVPATDAILRSLPDLAAAGDFPGVGGTESLGGHNTAQAQLGASGIANSDRTGAGLFANGRGTSAALILLLLALFPVLGNLTRRAADAVLAAPTATGCPDESEDRG